MSVEAVTFDVGGTLIKSWPSVGHVYAEVAARNGWPGLAVNELNRQFSEAWRAQEHFNYTRAAWAELVDATFRGLVKPLPSRTFFRELYDRFSEPGAWHVFEDVRPALRALASCNVGFAKPSPAIFAHAAGRLALPPDAILHVGDSPEMDLRGAEQAGLQAVLLRRGAGALGNGEIRSLSDLL